MENPDVTFIIPTLGRPTLNRALLSIQNQTIPNWKTIVCFDRTKSTIESTNKVDVMEFTSSISGWRAGIIRNICVARVTTEFCAFLDDDDTITPDYLERLREVMDQTDVVVMQMQFPSPEKVLPKTESDIYKTGRVGISFACRKEVFSKVRFRPQRCEDVFFLREANMRKFRIKFHPHIVYHVQH